MQRETWLIYALGGGWGHACRALALGRVAAKKHNIIILTSSPYASWVDSESCQIITIPPNLTQCSAIAQILEVLSTLTYDCLLVDTFPRGLLGELATFLPRLVSTPRILIHRDLNPNYVTAKQLPEFVSRYYDLVIAVEPRKLPLSDLPITRQTSPWLLRSASELPSPETARSRLQLISEKKLILVLASGRPEEQSLYGHLTHTLAKSEPDYDIHCLSAVIPPTCPPDLWRFYFPALECLCAAHLVIGSGGYNTVYECLALGIPLIAFPFPRLYDRQRDRLQQVNHRIIAVDKIEAAITVAHHWLNDPTFLPPSYPPEYPNGVFTAIKEIDTLITQKRIICG